jgi:hypothetical protein
MKKTIIALATLFSMSAFAAETTKEAPKAHMTEEAAKEMTPEHKKAEEGETKTEGTK